MTELLELAVEAHGGLERWTRLKEVKAHATVGGGIWGLKGWPDALKDVRFVIDPHRQHTESWSLPNAGTHSLYETMRTAILGENGEIVEQRDSPRRTFDGHTLMTRWDVHHMIYFSGYAIWTYLTTPFLFTLPGFKTEEIEPWQENDQIWRRLKVTFPPTIESHSREQTFYFDASGILTRHDYSVDIMGGTSSANYATEPKSFDGFVFPTKRRVFAIGANNQPFLERLAVAIDFHNIEFNT
jgi:hypothetical protein